MFPSNVVEASEGTIEAAMPKALTVMSLGVQDGQFLVVTAPEMVFWACPVVKTGTFLPETAQVVASTTVTPATKHFDT